MWDSPVATGPHLHYEFRVNNHQVDPLAFISPPALLLESSQLKLFRERNPRMGAHLTRCATPAPPPQTNILGRPKTGTASLPPALVGLGDQAEKLEPHPQVEVALGFRSRTENLRAPR